MSRSPAAILYDASGNPLQSVLGGDGNHNLGVASTQNVVASQNNNSTANLAPSGAFTGLGETTLGVAGIQVNLVADQPCKVQVQQSMDNTNWDISDYWHARPGVGDSRTFQATASYFRLIVTNLGTSTTTYLRLQTALCPVVEAVPRSLSHFGNLKVALAEGELAYECWEGRLYSFVYEGMCQSTETPFIHCSNPPGNSLDAVVSEFLVDLLTKNQQVTVRVYGAPTITSEGTPVPISNRLAKAGAPASVMSVKSDPTVSDFGTKMFVLSAGINSNSLVYDVRDGLIVGPGTSFLATVQGTASNMLIGVGMVWVEK